MCFLRSFTLFQLARMLDLITIYNIDSNLDENPYNQN